jgi:hypothetical protein
MKALLSSFALAIALFPLRGNTADVEHLKFFENRIRPLLSAECYECHGEEKQKGGLRLDHIDFIQEGGDTGPALVAGNPDESLLMQVVRREDPDFAMPPKSELTAEQIGLLEQWIQLGAPWPAESVHREETDENGFTSEDRKWWAIQPLAKVQPPSSGGDWAKNEIDHFIARKLEENHLQPAEVAGGSELVRRIYFDLHGLPPGADEAAEFIQAYQENPDKAVSETVDRLLASPRYGERWGQHWLDVVRFAESDGYRADDLRPESWRYRDYVIRSFNEDKPYDQFVREQLAADELSPDDPEKLIGTAFLRLGIYEWNQRNARMQWDLIMTEMTNVTGEAFLGLGVGCAQCHDHKFDPILQKDYFALQAFLNTTWWPENATLATPEQRREYESAMAAWEKDTAAIRSEISALQQPKLDSDVTFIVKQFPEDVQKVYYKPQSGRTAYEEQLAQLVQRQVDNKHQKLNWEKEFAKKPEVLTRYKELTAKLKEFEDRKPQPLPSAFVSTDVKPKPATTFFEKRGEKIPVEPAFFTLLDLPEPQIQPTERTTGRRTALANWITDEKNPLSTRVIVNRVWQRHFHQGLVPTPNDFGRLGEEPSHPELLDWLTERFLEGGWKIKSLHRLLMNSATYRQTARREPTSTETITDPQNRLLWRFPPHRLDAEQIRDAMLASSGELTHREGGSSVGGSSTNRSVYVTKRRNTKDSMIGGFDAPNGFSSAPTRTSTTTPTQSLLLVNGEWAMDRATAFAKRILAGSQTIGADQIRSAYQIAYGREPLTSEVEGALAFIQSQSAAVGAPAPPEPKSPGETGLRPIDQVFKGIESPALGKNALWLQPGSRFERLEITEVNWPAEEFTIEAVANIDSLHKDASVNTLAGRWNGSQEEAGWSLGITSEKSRYEPRNFIMQLIGEDFQHNVIYEVVASDLRFPIQSPTYIAASISAKPQPDNPTSGSVTFYLKDLSDPKAPLQSKTVAHQIVGGLAAKESVKALLGGRDQKGHLWDGQLARITVSKGSLTEKQLLINGGTADRVFDFQFNGENGARPEDNTAWLPNTSTAPKSGYPPQLLGAVTDFCHALLSSNEFLYLH